MNNHNNKFPNQGTPNGGEQSKVNPDNYFRTYEIELLQKKYLQFTVFFETLTEVLELDRHCTVEQFGMRIRDLVYAANQTDSKQSEISEMEQEIERIKNEEELAKAAADFDAKKTVVS